LATSRRAIREAVMVDLGLGVINLHGQMTDGDSMVVTSVRDFLGDTDNRILEGAYVFFKNKVARIAYDGTATTSGGGTATQTTVSVLRTAAAYNPQVGDYIEIAGSEVVLLTAMELIGATGAFTGTIIRAMLDTTAEVWTNSDTIKQLHYGQWRAISSHSFSTNTIELVRTISPAATTSVQQFDVYFILTPKEIDDCINQALTKLWFKDKVSISLADDDNYYDLTSSASWLTDSTQIMSLDYRYTSDSVIREWPSNHRKFEVTDDNVSVILYDIPSTVTGYSLYLTGRHWYEPLTHDYDTTTCPLPLIRAQAKVEVLQKIFNKLGPAAKQNYGQEMVLADAECERMRSRYRQAIIPIDLSLDEPWEGPEVPVRDGQYEW
jgi:hypothetical protein